jgi:ribosomal protein S24E
MSAVDVKTEKVGNTMTQREFFNAVIAANISTEMNDYAQELIDKLDRKNESRKNSTSPKQKANADFKTEIYNYMAETPNRAFTAKELADKYNTPENPITTQRISALMKQMVDTGTVTVFRAKDSKKNMVNWYQVTRTDEAVEETEEEE